MITNRTAKLAKQATAMLLARKPNISLETIEGSPLDQLVDASATIKRTGISLEEAISETQQSSMAATFGDGSAHDMVMDETVDEVTAALNSSVNFARKVLAPATAKVEQAVKEALANFAPARYYVEPYHIHDILFSDALTESVGRFDNSPIDKLQRLALGDISEADLTGMLSTGMGGWDNQVSDWLASKPEGWLQEVYNRVFGSATATALIAEHEQALRSDLQGKLEIVAKIGTEDYLLAGYLLATALYNNPQSTNATGHEWKNTMATWVQQLGRALCIFQRSAARQISNKLMVLHWPQSERAWVKNQDEAKIVVLGNAYNEWLKEGGSPEVLIGALFGGDSAPPVSASDLTAKKDAYALAYQRYEKILSREVAARADDAIRNAFAGALMLALGEATDDQLPVGVEREKLQEALSNRITDMRDWGNLDVYRTARELLALGVFHKPTALHFLETIDDLMDADTSLSPQEAAYVAIRDYVSQYVSNQIRVTSAPAVAAA